MGLAPIALGGFVFAAGFIMLSSSPIRRRIGHGLIDSAIGETLSADERRLGRVDPLRFSRADIARIDALRTEGLARFGKRALDLALAIALLIGAAPLLILTAIAIKLDSPGPVLYRQRRVGLDGEEFEIFKFRSMRTDAEQSGAQWARKNDDRITRVGRLIRRTRIDEIPQAFNVLRGEMSFVGPRPERPEFVAVLESEIPNYHSRHRVKPGITGWAQVRHEYTASVEGARDKLSYDLFYVKHFSLLLDLLIVLMTIRVALLGIGSR